MASAFRDFEHDGWADPAVCASYDDLLRAIKEIERTRGQVQPR